MASIRHSISTVSYSPQRVLPRQDNKDRLHKIQQKLQTITVQRHNQAKEDAQELMTKRVLQLETKSTEEIKRMDDQMHLLKEELCQLKLRQNQQNKKNLIHRKKRQIQIVQLQKKVIAMISYETKERKEKQNFLVKNLEDKQLLLGKDITDLQKRRTAEMNIVDQNLARDLPDLNLTIQGTCAEVQNQLEKLHKEVRANTGVFKEKIESQAEAKEAGFKKVIELVNDVVDQIKKDIEQERKSHQQNKEKLLALFASASEKLEGQ